VLHRWGAMYNKWYSNTVCKCFLEIKNISLAHCLFINKHIVSHFDDETALNEKTNAKISLMFLFGLPISFLIGIASNEASILPQCRFKQILNCCLILFAM
jgi:hypothetical protein